jgi:hypothetical protein
MKAKYVGTPFFTRGEFGEPVLTVTLMTWGYCEETDDVRWFPSDDGHAWGAWDSDFGWVIVSFNRDDPDFVEVA